MQNKEFESLACNIRPTLLKTATYIVADGMAAEDVVQDTLLKLWVLRGNLDGYESVEGLALTIARRLALNYLRASNPARFASLSDDDTATLTDSGPSPEDQIISHENEAILGEAISALPPPQQTLIRLRHVEGLDCESIAALLGSSNGAVRTALSRARQNVAKIFLSKN